MVFQSETKGLREAGASGRRTRVDGEAGQGEWWRNEYIKSRRPSFVKVKKSLRLPSDWPGAPAESHFIG